MIEIRESDINGKGVFATEDIPSGAEIGIWCCTEKRNTVRVLYNEGMSCAWYETAILGRYCNHSNTPNTEMLISENSISLLSKGIMANEEILVDYKWCEMITGYKVDLSGF